MAKAEFFEKMANLGLALSFDDVRLKTGHSEVMPTDVDLSTMFSRRIPLRIPIVSAAMDTVTESAMAIELAKLGGLGVIHRKLPIKDQASEVTRVKFYMNGRIHRPICVHPGDTIAQVLTMIDPKNPKCYLFRTFPVVNEKNRLVGLLTGRRIQKCSNPDNPVSAVMATNLVTAPTETSLNEAYNIMVAPKNMDISVLPLVDEDSQLTGMYVFSDIMRIKSGDASVHNVDANGQLLVGAAVGTGYEALERTKALIQAGVDVIVVDTAHGDSKPVYEILKKLKCQYGDRIDIVVGNISQPDSAKRLVDAGADGIKIGQGPGSICTTRIIAGIGKPQITAVYECAKVIEGSGIPICADGGIRNSGDIAIVIGAGAHSVMLGNLLAGTDPAPGDIVTMPNGQRVKMYRGMGSLSAMQESAASRERYRQGEKTDVSKLVPEGIEGAVPYKGPIASLVNQYTGGLRSGMGYVGAVNIQELREKGDFDRITPAGLAESHPHDVIMVREAPNYRGRN